MATEILRPNAAGDLTQCSKTGVTYNWEAVDDESPDEDTTRVYAIAYGASTDLYNIPSPAGTDVISKITIYSRCRRTGSKPSPTATAKIKIGGSTYSGATRTPETYTTYTDEWALNPYTGVAWTLSDIASLQIGVYLVGSNWTGYSTYCTQLYLEITFVTSLTPIGISQAIALGAATVFLVSQLISPTGFSQQVAYGAPVLFNPQTLTPTGIEQVAAYGAPELFYSLGPPGIEQLVLLGTPTIFNPHTLDHAGIEQLVAYGTPALMYAQFIYPGGIEQLIAAGASEVGTDLRPFAGETVNFIFYPTRQVEADLLLLRQDMTLPFSADLIICPPFFDKTVTADMHLSKANVETSVTADTLLKATDVSKSLTADIILWKLGEINGDLLSEQKKPKVTPYVLVRLTKGGTTYDYVIGNKVKEIPEEYIDPYKHRAKIVLDNKDQSLSNLDFKGFDCTIYWGLKIGTQNDAIASPSARVWLCTYDSSPGVLTLTLDCKGITTRMADDRASKGWTGLEASGGPSAWPPPWESSARQGTVRWLIEKLVSATLEPFSHCEAHGFVWHNIDPTLEHVPGENFVIEQNAARLEVLRYLLDRTASSMRVMGDNKLHFFKPVTSGTDYDYQYELDGEHTFFTKQDLKRVVIPNYFTVDSYETIEDSDPPIPKYTGYAVDAESASKYGQVRYFDTLNVQSHEEAKAMAEALLGSQKANKKWIEAVVPMNVFALTHDYVKITDQREGTTAIGNVGVIKRYFKPGIYRMIAGFGGWFDALALAKFLKPYTGKQTEAKKKVDWMQASFSAVRLAPNQFMTFQDILMPPSTWLYVLAYSIYAQAGAAQLDIAYFSGTTWHSVGQGFPKGNNNWKKYETPEAVFANFGGHSLPLRMLVRNVASGEYAVDAEFVTGFVAYDIRKYYEEI